MTTNLAATAIDSKIMDELAPFAAFVPHADVNALGATLFYAMRIFAARFA